MAIHERLSPPLAPDVFTAKDGIASIASHQEQIQADSLLDADKDVIVVAPIDSDNPLRVYMIPSESEVTDPTTMMVSKLGVMSIYWKELADAIISPDKLWRNTVISISIVPTFLDAEGNFHLYLQDYDPRMNKRIMRTAKYAKHVRSINFGGDGDFFSDCQTGDFTVNMYRFKRDTLHIAAQSLGVTEEQRRAVRGHWSFFHQELSTFYTDTVSQMLKQSQFEQPMQAWLAGTHVFDPIIGDFDIARRAVHQGMSEQLTFDTLDAVQKQYKQNLYDRGMNSPLWQAANLLVGSMNGLHETAKANS